MKFASLICSLLVAACAVEPYEPTELDDPFADKSTWEPYSTFFLERCPSTNLADLSMYMHAYGAPVRPLGPASMVAEEHFVKTISPTLWMLEPGADISTHTTVKIVGAPDVRIAQVNSTVSLELSWGSTFAASCVGYTPAGKQFLECTLAMRMETGEDVELGYPPDGPGRVPPARLVGKICEDGRYQLVSPAYIEDNEAATNLALALWGRI